jgi:hypothetical protein
MKKKNIAIFGFPRSGTKLLADAHVQNDYFNYGEFFDTFSSELVFHNGVAVAKRCSRSVIEYRKNQRILDELEDNIKKTQENFARIQLFEKQKSISPSIVTVWSDSLIFAPILMNTLSDRFFLCTQRANKVEQILSLLVSSSNFNFNGEIKSEPKIFDLKEVHFYTKNFRLVEWMQHTIVSTNRGRYIDFDRLISGNEDLGFEYKVTSNDQHSNLAELVINLDDVTDEIEKTLKKCNYF